ncbi:MAG TPA: hypothetical protein VIH99_10565 [Bdellovibrionota bacterium]
MKTSLLLALALLTSPLAKAETMADLTADTTDLINSVNVDVKYLYTAVDDCTRHGDRVRTEMLRPIYDDLKGFRTGLAATYGKFANPVADQACNRPTSQQLDQAIAASNKIIAVIHEKEVQSSTSQPRLFGKTGDEVMILALSADSSYPKCPATERGKPESTRQLKTYFVIKANLLKLQDVMKQLKAKAAALQRGATSELVCVSK